jgi:hypothetical protein
MKVQLLVMKIVLFSIVVRYGIFMLRDSIVLSKWIITHKFSIVNGATFVNQLGIDYEKKGGR